MSEKNNFCPNCGFKVSNDKTFCPNCGYELPKTESTDDLENKFNICPNCGTQVKLGEVFCPNCGAKLTIPEKKLTQAKVLGKQTDNSKLSADSTDKKENSSEDDEKSQSKPSHAKKVQVFCPNCGHPIKPDATFCNNCGYNLITKELPKASSTPEAQPVTSQKVRQPMKLRTKILLSILGVLLIALIGFYAWGSSYYSKNNQIDRITDGLRNTKTDISQYIIADTSTMKVNDNTVKPLQQYYQDHQTTVTSMAQKLKDGESANDHISLIQNGRYWLLFPKYQLKVQTFQPQVETNHGDSVITMNGKNVGKLTGSDNKFGKKLGLVFPGKYHFTVKSQVEGRTLSATSTTNIWANKTLSMDIKTQTFKVKSVPKGEVYINDKKVGTLDKDGEITFKSYPITRNMELYVLYNGIKSEIVNDMASSFDDFTDESDEDDYYSDDASDQESDDVTQENGTYVVQPKWKGLISKDDAKSLLDDNYHDPDDDSFVNGSANKWYGQIKQQNDRWDKDDSMDSYDTDVTIESIYPDKGNQSKVNYRVNYTFEYDDRTKKQVVEYTGGTLKKDGDDYLINTIGDGKLISSRDEDN